MNDRLKNITKQASIFYSKIENWISQEPNKDIIHDYVNKNLSFEEFQKQYSLLKNLVVKKHISSTHTWIEGKSHYLKKYENWYQSNLECAVCKMHATKLEEVWVDFIETTDIPSRDTHNHLISRTCQEVLDARKQYRKSRKGTKCYQCWTYGCLFKSENND